MGNINEALDVWYHNISLPPLKEDDHIAFINAGAYSSSMASNHVFEPLYHSGLMTIKIGELQLILVSNKPIDLAQARSMDYFYVDWGTHFSSQHQQMLADKLTPSLSFNFSSMARDYLLEQGGLCYLSQIEAQEFIHSGRLHKVVDAPEFQRQIFYCYRKSNSNAAILQSIAGI